MAPHTVVLTGATGSLGAVILSQLLAQKHNVNAVLRSFTKSRAFLEDKYAAAVRDGQLTFTKIPDMTVAHVFDDVASTASAFLHVATPVDYSDFENSVIKPAFKITDNVLRAAAASATLKRVIITGSVVATMRVPNDMASGRTISEADFNPIPRAEASADVRGAYQYSKVSTEQEAWKFMDREKPGFDLVILLIPSTTGRSIHEGYKPTKTELGGISSIYRAVFDVAEPGFMFPYYMDIEDVAHVHIKSLDASAVPGNQRYLFAAREKIVANRLADKIRAELPHLRERVPKGKEGDGLPPTLVKLDTSRADKVFGTQWKGWWESAMATIEDLLAYEGKYGRPQ